MARFFWVAGVARGIALVLAALGLALDATDQSILGDSHKWGTTGIVALLIFAGLYLAREAQWAYWRHQRPRIEPVGLNYVISRDGEDANARELGLFVQLLLKNFVAHPDGERSVARAVSAEIRLGHDQLWRGRWSDSEQPVRANLPLAQRAPTFRALEVTDIRPNAAATPLDLGWRPKGENVYCEWSNDAAYAAGKYRCVPPGDYVLTVSLSGSSIDPVDLVFELSNPIGVGELPALGWRKSRRFRGGSTVQSVSP